MAEQQAQNIKVLAGKMNSLEMKMDAIMAHLSGKYFFFYNIVIVLLLFLTSLKNNDF